MIVAIPARLASTRLPNKLMLDIGGKPLLWHTICRALESDAAKVVVLAEDHELAEAVQSWKWFQKYEGRLDVRHTGPARSGTERIALFAKDVTDNEVIVNLQGDEPELAPAFIGLAAHVAANSSVDVVTLASKIDETTAQLPGIVKVVSGFTSALYFSRSPIPYGGPWFRHIGLYAYRGFFLKNLHRLAPPLHPREDLEQLQWLENGQTIHVVVVNHPYAGVDTQHDYEATKARLIDAH